MFPQLIWRWFNGTHKKRYWQQTAPSNLPTWVFTQLITPTLPQGAKSITDQITNCLHSFL